jgi:hypothetical protein
MSLNLQTKPVELVFAHFSVEYVVFENPLTTMEKRSVEDAHLERIQSGPCHRIGFKLLEAYAAKK